MLLGCRARERAGKIRQGGQFAVLLAVVFYLALLPPPSSPQDSASLGQDSNSAGLFDREAYQAYREAEVASLPEIVSDFEWNQALWMPLAPPSDEWFDWTQHAETTPLPFDPTGFPDSFVAGLVPTRRSGAVVYPVKVFEDLVTRERVFLNVEGREIAAQPAPPGYDPDWIVRGLFPGLFASGSIPQEIELLRRTYDPARIAIQYNLVLHDDLVKYLIGTALERERAKKKDPGVGIMSAYNGPPVTNLQITAIEFTNGTSGLKVTLAYPWENGNPTNSYTNGLEVFGCDDLIAYWWTSVGTTNPCSTTNWIEWIQPGFTNISLRFYRFGNADLDSDSDGLTDARELLMYHCSPTNSDTDADTLSDYEEAINLNTDPSNPDTNKPAASIVFPPDGYRWVWTP